MTQKEEVKIVYIEGILLKNKYSIIDTIEHQIDTDTDTDTDTVFSHSNPYIIDNLDTDLPDGFSFTNEFFDVSQFFFERMLFIQIDVNRNDKMS
jgi:hypothetical protein